MAHYTATGLALNPSAPDPAPSLYDDVDNLRDVLIEADYPDYIAAILADCAYRGWRDEDAADLMRDLRRHVQPLIDEAEQEACSRCDDDYAEVA